MIASAALVWLFTSVGVCWADPPAAPRRPCYALLVGCTRYVNLPAACQLEGPANDVLLMRDMLVGRFGFPKQSVTILAESEGEASRPIRANIEREFHRLAGLAKRDDQIVIHLAGHGSQQPCAPPPLANDVDAPRWHKIFLPADVGTWDQRRATVANAITDDEFHAWIGEIRKTGASLWIIVDACHSGGMIRGADDEVVRHVPARLIVPQEVLRKAEAAGRTRGGSAAGDNSEDPGLGVPPESMGMAVVYAAQGDEVTVEKTLPTGAPDAKRYGLFSFTVNQVLLQAATPLTYSELIQRVEAKYQQAGRRFPTPLVQGKERDREVLGTTDWPGRSHILLKKGDFGLMVTAGAIFGLTNGSILAVYPPAGEKRGERPLGYVRIVERRTLDAAAQACDYGGLAADANRLPADGVCVPVVVDYGDLRLIVAVDPRDGAGRPAPEAERRRLHQELDRLGKEEGSLIRPVDNAARAAWLVRWDSGRVCLAPTGGLLAAPSGKAMSPLFGPAPAGSELTSWLKERLQRIARAENLRQLASSSDETVRGGFSVPVEFRRLRSKSDREGEKTRMDGLAFHGGDRVAILIHNPNRFSIDATLLYIDSNCGIDSLFPSEGEINRLQPGEAKRLRLRITDQTVGMEHVVVIAVRGTGSQPADFSMLAQPSLDRARGADSSRGKTLETPLGRLLKQSLYAGGRSRSLVIVREADEDCSMRLITWRVLPPRVAAP